MKSAGLTWASMGYPGRGIGEVVEAEGNARAMDRWASGGAEWWWGGGRGRCYAFRNTHVNRIANRQLRVKGKIIGGIAEPPTLETNRKRGHPHSVR